MTLDRDFILFSGVMPRFSNSIIKVAIPNELMLYVTVILSWIDDYVVKKYIYESSTMDLINGLCYDRKMSGYKT